MYRHNLAYRHLNGDLEGFSAFRFGKERARAACLQEIRTKCEALQQPYDPARVIKAFGQFSKAEQASVRRDWGTYDRPHGSVR